MNYKVNGICNRCSDYTLIDVETRLCENCSESELTFIDAIQKYDKITNDGGETIYTTNKEGTIIMKTKGTGGGFSVTVDLLTSTGWKEYKEGLTLPNRKDKFNTFFYINSYGHVGEGSEEFMPMEDNLMKNYNYFVDENLAHYIAHKQLIQRIELTLYELNKDKFSEEEIENLLMQYLEDNFKVVLDRIKKYENKLG